ncbi:MAG: Ig-like domain-containing protein, partial [Deltaproteobacteria bacterium]|nr:Ig-like domain-containing protein [Deltaproteobacteria bacterium]
MKLKARGKYGLVVHLLVIALFTITLSACPSGTSGGGGGGTGATASIALTADPESIPADGKSSATITATLLSSSGTAVASGTLVKFSATLGTFSNGESSYQVTYKAAATEEGATAATESVITVSLISGLVPGAAAVTAESNGVKQTVSITFTGEGGTGTPAFISLATTKTSVKSDNSDSATVTATVLNSSYAVVPGVTVVFTADGGSISASSAETDASGLAQITFKSGTVDKGNKTVTIIARVSGLQSQIPLKIVGSTLTLATSMESIPDDGSTRAVLTITAKDAGGVEVFDAPLTLTVSGAGGAALVQFSADYLLDFSQAPVYSGKTDVLGQFKVYVSGTQAGAVTITAQGLGDTKDVAYTINPASSVTFGIAELESPEGTSVAFQDPFSLSTNTHLKIIVNAPDAGETAVVFATTVGGWVEAAGQQVYAAPIAGGKATAVLNSAAAGLASVQVNYSSGGTPTDSMTVAISAPSSEAAQITIQSSAYVVAPSSGGVTNSVTLKA